MAEPQNETGENPHRLTPVSEMSPIKEDGHDEGDHEQYRVKRSWDYDDTKQRQAGKALSKDNHIGPYWLQDTIPPGPKIPDHIWEIDDEEYPGTDSAKLNKCLQALSSTPTGLMPQSDE